MGEQSKSRHERANSSRQLTSGIGSPAHRKDAPLDGNSFPCIAKLLYCTGGPVDGRNFSGDRVVKKSLHSIKTKMLSDRAVRTAYDALADEFNLARELIGARVRAGLTQAELADRMGTTQSAIARLESGARMPSVNTLLKFAKATRSRPVIKLRAA
ncbi:MAG TPA: helix-turn-helix transcriptional regulator [Candidatus Binataceae bacterium]|nr:helix-turn-helix transcriptional regulator [Candidatus Binataceae bacterium]